MYDRAPRKFTFQMAVGTDEGIGPGAYEWGSVDRSKLRADGYAPFNSLASRDTFLNPSDSAIAAPGPGQYDPRLGESVAKGCASLHNRANRFSPIKSDGPGPGQYTVVSKWKHETRFASADPSKDKSGQMMVSSRIRYQRKPEAPSIPIPGQAYGYEEAEDGCLVKQDPPPRDKTIGPAFYNPTVEETFTTRKYKGCHWARDRAPRTNFGGADGPGPGEYEQCGDSAIKISHANMPDGQKPHELNIPRFSEKVIKDEIKKHIPGPGAYEHRGFFDTSPVKLNDDGIQIEHPPFGVQASRFGRFSDDIPGPGSYNDPRNALGALKKISGMKRSPFGVTAVRFSGEHARGIPGPGTYGVVGGIASESLRQAYLASVRRGAFGSTAVRLQPMAKQSESDLPGPGHYQVKDKPYQSKYSQPLSSMFASMTDRDFNPAAKDKEKPPPDSYNVVESFSKSQGRRQPQPPRNEEARRRNRSFGISAARFGPGDPLTAGDRDIPGPGSYSLQSKLAGGVMFPRDDRFRFKAEDIPGPGQYEFHSSVMDTVLKGTHNTSLGNPITAKG